jgi:hypothetical protein
MKTDPPQGRQVGMTLVCPQCDLAVVVVELGDAAAAALTCHATTKPARPMRCWRVYSPPPGAAMVAGALYTDESSGFTVRCIRPGSGTLRLEGKSLRTPAAQQLRRTAV